MAASGAFEESDDLPELGKFRIQYGADKLAAEDTPLDDNGGGGGYSWMQD